MFRNALVTLAMLAMVCHQVSARKLHTSIAFANAGGSASGSETAFSGSTTFASVDDTGAAISTADSDSLATGDESETSAFANGFTESADAAGVIYRGEYDAFTNCEADEDCSSSAFGNSYSGTYGGTYGGVYTSNAFAGQSSDGTGNAAVDGASLATAFKIDP